MTPGTEAEADRATNPVEEVASLRDALLELVLLKDLKMQTGETADYRVRRERAWNEARRVLGSSYTGPD